MEQHEHSETIILQHIIYLQVFFTHANATLWSFPYVSAIVHYNSPAAAAESYFVLHIICVAALALLPFSYFSLYLNSWHVRRQT